MSPGPTPGRRHGRAGCATRALPADAGLLGRLARLGMLIDAELDRVSGGRGIAYPDYLVLATVRRSAGGLGRPTEMSALLGRRRRVLAVDRLEAAGWVRREPDARDRRRNQVVLTDPGQLLAETVNADLHEWEQSLPLVAAHAVEMPAEVAQTSESLTGWWARSHAWSPRA